MQNNVPIAKLNKYAACRKLIKPAMLLAELNRTAEMTEIAARAAHTSLDSPLL